MNAFLWITLLAPFAGAGFVLLTPGTSCRAVRAGSILAAAAAAAGALGLFAAAGPVPPELTIPWLPSIGLSVHLRADGFARALLAASAVVGLAAVLAAGCDERTKGRHLLLLLTLGASLCAFASRDLFFLYFFCEVTTLPKYLLTAWGRLPEGRYRTTPGAAALQMTLFIAAGAMVALVALVMLYSAGGGSLDLDALRAHFAAHPDTAALQRGLFGALLLGFGVWTAIWPLHTWSPIGYAAMPAPAAMLFAGVAKNFGAYALLRIGTEAMPEGARTWSAPLAAIAIVQILYGGWAAMRQKDWSFIVAYSSISHVGYLLLALAAAFGPVGAAAAPVAVFFMVAHSLSVALLFALTGGLEQSCGSRFPEDLGGLARAVPFLAVAFAAGVIATSGLPGFANFAAELLVFFTAWKAGGTLFHVAAAAAVWGVVVTATYLFRALRTTFYGEPRTLAAGLRPLAPAQRAAILLLVAASLAAGLWPRLVTRTLDAPPPAGQGGAP